MNDDSVIDLPYTTRRDILSREINNVLVRVDQSFSAVLEEVEDDLFCRAEASHSNRDRQLILDAYSRLKARRAPIESRFRKALKELLEDELSGSSRSAPKSLQDTDWDALSLVEDDEVEDEVSVQRLSDKIKTQIEWELRDLNARMTYLAGQVGADEQLNPLRPELFCRALVNACEELDSDRTLRQTVIAGFEGAFAQSIGVVYKEVNARLVSHRVLPKIRHVAPQRRLGEARVPSGDSPPSGSVGPVPMTASDHRLPMDEAVDHVVESTLSMFDALQKLVSNAPGYRQGLEEPVNVGSRRPLFSAIHELRRAHVASMQLAESPPEEAPQGAGSNIIWANHQQLLSAASHPVDRMKVDIVAMLFDQILCDDKVPTRFRMLFGRLQLPVLRIALSDGSFFASRAHPTRRLIDRMASCAVGYEPGSEGSERLAHEIERLVATVMEQAEADTVFYQQLLASFETFIALEHARSNDIVGRAADALERTEMREVLAINATIQINQMLDGVSVEPRVKDFLLDVWVHVLVETACRHEDANRDVAIARNKAVCSQLIWSGQPKTTPEDRRRLVQSLPGMIQDIRNGFALIAYPADKEAAFFTILMQVHSHAVKTAGSVPESASSIDDFTKKLEAWIIADDAAQVVVPASIDMSSRAMDRAVAEAGDSLDVVDLPAQEHEQAPRPNEYVTDCISRIERGDWFDLVSDGQFERVRLAWVSPLRTFFLFTGQTGSKARSMNPATLSSLFRTGNLRYVEDEPLLDRAVRTVMGRLETESAAA